MALVLNYILPIVIIVFIVGFLLIQIFSKQSHNQTRSNLADDVLYNAHSSNTSPRIEEEFEFLKAHGIVLNYLASELDKNDG